MIGKFHLPISAGGALPDPATYCPANGYILNPINPTAGWNLICEFQTNSPSTTTFDPTITGTIESFAWDLGNGYLSMGVISISHTYSDGSVKTVKLYAKTGASVTAVDFNTDNLIGQLDISNAAFSTLAANGLLVHTNSGLTGLLLPSSISGIMGAIRIYSTGIEGTLNLTSITNIVGCLIYLYSNPSLTGLTFASTISGTVNQLYAYSNNLTGILNLAMFNSFTVGSAIRLDGNPNLTDVTFGTTMSGTIGVLYIYYCGINTTLNLSMLTFAASTTLFLNNNASMTGLLLPNSGNILTLRLYSNTSLGYVDFTLLSTSINNLSWTMQNNGWTATIVNHILVDIDGISAGGFTGRVINIGGTNADPDTTSGGYNGIAARNSLIAKGFTVTIT